MAMNTREEIGLGQLAVRFLVKGKDSGGSVAIFELDVPAGAKVPIAHSHDAYEETIYGIEGVITFTLEGRTIEIGPGDALCIPRYPTGSGPPLRQPSPRHIQNARNRQPRHPRPGLLPRNRRHRQSRSHLCTPNPKALAEVMRRHGLTPAP
jgi:hypothetical protein